MLSVFSDLFYINKLKKNHHLLANIAFLNKRYIIKQKSSFEYLYSKSYHDNEERKRDIYGQ